MKKKKKKKQTKRKKKIRKPKSIRVAVRLKTHIIASPIALLFLFFFCFSLLSSLRNVMQSIFFQRLIRSTGPLKPEAVCITKQSSGVRRGGQRATELSAGHCCLQYSKKYRQAKLSHGLLVFVLFIEEIFSVCSYPFDERY